jgi:hypothetical protein
METEKKTDEVKEAFKKDIMDKKLKAIKRLLPTGFAENSASAQTTELKEIITTCAIQKVQLANEEATDENLISLQDRIADLKVAYRETRSTFAAKIKWCVHLLEERGDK